MNDTTKNLDDFGEVIQGAKKHNFADLDLSKTETKKLPLSKLWVKSDIDDIKDVSVAAIAHRIRSQLPTKPRSASAQARWFGKLEEAQTAVAWLMTQPENSKAFIERLESGRWNDRVSAFAIHMMVQTDRQHWDKMSFDIRQDGFIVRVNETNYRYNATPTTNIVDVVAEMKPIIEQALEELGQEKSSPNRSSVAFDIYQNRSTNVVFIAARPDKEKSRLMIFDSIQEAREYLYAEDMETRLQNLAHLNELWQQHKELNNIKKSDMRSSANAERTGNSHRNGRDITPEEFMRTFNIRGGQFGNWVKGDERQTHLNQAYDAFMDLSQAANIPPNAIGLNGELGIAFGARGSGFAAAHYETEQKVINLTKTKGAGSLAHEWWHALDHYLGGKDLATRDYRSIQPENMRHTELSEPLKAILQVARTTKLQQRSNKADGSRNKPYFGTNVEMTARAFESYIADKLAKQGIRNDYLVNITQFESWKRNPDAYVYLKDDEIQAFTQVYDGVFDKLSVIDKNFARQKSEQNLEQGFVFDSQNQQEAIDLHNQLFYTGINDRLMPSKYHQYESYPVSFTDLLEEAKIFANQFPNESNDYLENLRQKITEHEIALTDFYDFKKEQQSPIAVEQTQFSSFNDVAQKYGYTINGYGRIFDGQSRMSDWKLVIEDNDFRFVRSYNHHKAASYPISSFEEQFKSHYAIKKDPTHQTELEQATKSVKDTYSQNIDDAIESRPLDSSKIWIGNTPKVLQMLGMQDLPVYIHRKTVLKDAIRKHNITAEDLKAIPSQLEHPIAIMKSAQTSSNPNAYLVLTELIEKENGKDKPVIAVLSVAQKEDSIEINSVYGRNQSQIERDLNNVLYWDSKKGQQFIDSFGYQLPPSLSNADLSHHYKTEQDLSQYILAKNNKEHTEQFLQIAAEIQAKVDNAPNKELSVFAQVIYEDIQSVHDKAQKDTPPTLDELEIAKRHLEGLNYSFEKNGNYYQFGGLINHAKMAIYHEIDRQDWQKVDDVQVSYDVFQDKDTYLYSIKINGKTYELSSQDIEQRNFDAIKADLGYVVHKQHAVEIPPDDKGSKLGISKGDEYLQKIADRILEQVKNNEAPWQRPFDAGTINNVLPVNGGSGQPYKGLNRINLMVAATINGYEDNRWFTYNNAQEAGGQVRKGEKGTQIHFWKFPSQEDIDKESKQAASEGREPKQLPPMLRIYTVFNAEQIDGLPERQLNETLLSEFERHEKAESILENSGVRIEHTPEKTGYYSAHYNPKTDTITLPQRELFVSEDAYYATALHELAHATGHESRLNRDLSGKFGSYSYAKEELRAEMASMMIGQELQLGHDPSNHYAYLQSWAAVIENDPKEFFKAAKDADLITNYVLDLDKTQEKLAEIEQQQGAEKNVEKTQLSEFGQPSQEQQANIADENRRLFVPYEQKDVASSLGARWDKENKCWYAPAGSDLDKFKPWLKEPVREFARPEDEFARQLEAHGLHLESGHPIMDGRWHRLKVDGDRTGKSGAYIGHLDGVPRGTVKNFKTGQETNWTAKDALIKSVPSSLDIERAKAAAEAKQKASYNQAADTAKLVLNHAQPAQNHPYLDKKGVSAHGLYVVPDKSVVNLENTNLAIANDWREAKAMRESYKEAGIEKQVLTKGDLIVPAINEHGDLRTFQTISGNNGSFKSFVKGGEKSGSYHVIGDLNNTKDVMIAEGYATAATLHEQTGKPVVVAFDAGNLTPVAEKIRQALPNARIYIAADNDRHNAVNTGVEKAIAAAEKVNAKVIIPQFDKIDDADKLSDWNDLHQANPHHFTAQLATSEMGRQDFADKLTNLPSERQEVFKGWYDYINEKLAILPEARNAKQASLEQEILKDEQGKSNLPSVADYQAGQAAKKQEQVFTQQPAQQATVVIQALAVNKIASRDGGFSR